MILERNTSAIYDIEKSYLVNAEEGPFFQGEIPKRPTSLTSVDCLGFEVASPIGVPAGPLLNSKWTALAFSLGYDVLVYKTIRSTEYSGHAHPNVVFIETTKPLKEGDTVYMTDKAPLKKCDLAITNSFGMPSRSNAYLEKDIAAANEHMRQGQLLIISIVGTPKGRDPEAFAMDFIRTALFAKECGAHAIEANFSCPNVGKEAGSIYLHAQLVYHIGKKLRDALGSTPLVLKMGVFPSYQRLRESLIAAARAGVSAIAGINTIGCKVVNSKGNPALGQERLISGICGAPIQEAALQFVRQARQIIDQERLEMQLFATGGVTEPQHFQDFLNAGADIVMTATGMMWDPYLAHNFHLRSS